MRGPRSLLATIGLAAAAVLLVAAPALGRVKDDDNLNYEFHVPDDWAWIDVSPFEKQSVVAGADRRLQTLADGKPADGQGGRALLSVKDPPKAFPTEDHEGGLYDWQQLELQAKTKDPVPEEMVKEIDAGRERLEKALADLAAMQEVQSLLLERFGKEPAQWPTPTVDARGIDIGTIPAAKISVEGECANHNGVVGKCQGTMHVWVLRKRMYRLVVWIWHTPRDREHLRDQRDEIELSMDMRKKEAIPKKAPPPKPDAGGDKPVAGPGGKGERQPLRDLAMGFEVVKPARFTAQEIDRSETKERDTAFRFQAENQGDSAIVEMFAYRIGTAGATGFDLKQYFGDMWTSFVKLHPAGPMQTSPFPPATPRNPFLSLPDLGKKKDVPRPADPAEKYSTSDMERVGVLQEVKNASVGREKVDHAWRYLMKGNIERVGDDWWLIYTFSTSARTYVIRITVRKGGWTTWKDDISEVLKSVTLIEEK